VYPVLTKSGINIGYVQLVPAEDGYEVGYHIAESYTCRGYATEALGCFLEYIMQAKDINKVLGICVTENRASCRVLEKCGFQKLFEGLGKYQGRDTSIAKYVYTTK
jgi:RimJ/RimL family protein N-acetyltransferase